MNILLSMLMKEKRDITIFTGMEMAKYFDDHMFSEFQNRGIGTAIIEKCCASVEEPVVLYVFIKNKKAVLLYERTGFEIAETIKDSRYVMKRWK